MSLLNKLFLLAILLSIALFPLIPSGKLGFSKKDIYAVASRNKGADHRFLHREIYNKTGDIDILFMGSSLLWVAINSKTIKTQLESKINRPATVLNFGHNWEGIDINYLYLKDLLQKRTVKMVVMATDIHRNTPHSNLWEIWDNTVDGPDLNNLSIKHRLTFYGARLLTDPKRFFNIAQQTIKPAALLSPDNPIYYLDKDFGDVFVKKGFQGAPYEYCAFSPIKFPPSQILNQNLEFPKSPISDYTIHFFKKTITLLKKYNAKLVWLNVPEWQNRRKQVIITNPLFETKDESSDFIGITGNNLFRDMNDADIKKFYYNNHLNANGNAYFTSCVSPTLLKIYDEKIGIN